jgi:hypothetical protein
VVSFARVAALVVLVAGALFAGGGQWRTTSFALSGCADVNGDGAVDGSDVDIVTSWFGSLVPPGPPAADLTKNGIIQTPDITAVVTALGTVTGCQTMPARGNGTFPGTAGDDVMPSIGKFRIVVGAPYRSLMSGYPGYDGVSRLESPLMSDPSTTVGRSAAHTHGSGADTSGTAVGTAGTIISDSSFSLVPMGFQGPAGVREVHTELRTMNLTAGGAAVRAGTAAPSQPISPGEVETYSTSGLPADDFPGESFFDVFVEVDLPAFGSFPGATVYNQTALLVRNAKLQIFPPRVVYVHDNSSAVPVLFKTTNPGFWLAGNVFGYLVLAGHGANTDVSDTAFVQQFEDVMDEVEQTQGEMPIVTGVGGVTTLTDQEAASLAATETSHGDATLVALAAAGMLVALVCGAWVAGLRASRL